MKETLHIKGMHCKSCEVILEERIGKVTGIKKVYADNKKNIVIIKGEGYDRTDIAEAVRDAGYEMGKEDLPLITKNIRDYKELIIAFIVVVAVFSLGKNSGFDRFFTYSTGNPNLAVVFTIGITAGLSTCMALIGGLVLAISARYSEKHPDSSAIQKFRPHLYFNFGRIISYFVFGGIIGILGAIISPSGSFLGIITIVLGVVMLILGIKLLEISPRLGGGIALPKKITEVLKINDKKEKEYSHLNSFILGGLTFFLPCGFTQAMQIYAISTRSFISGALIMGIFALGTTPGLLGIGGLVAVIKKGFFSRFFFKTIGIIVIALAFYNISTGLNLTGFKSPFSTKNSSLAPVSDDQTSLSPTILGDTQVLKATFKDQTIKPNKFNVKSGKPVRLEIEAKEDELGCMGSVMIPGLVDEPQFFQKGKTVILEFTSHKTGQYDITCAMGIPSGTITVEN